MGDHARQEAHAMLALLRAGESVESIRELIGTRTPVRRSIRLHFDVLADPETRIPQFLHRGWSQKQIHARFGIAVGRIRTISVASRACTDTRRGRGRRFSSELKTQIEAAIREGKRPAEIAREFGISVSGAMKARRALGFLDRRIYIRRVSDDKINAVVQQLKNGASWCDAARNVGIAVHTAVTRTSYRKGRQSKRPSDERLADATERAKRGESWSELAKEFDVCRSALLNWISWRKVVKKHWSAEQTEFVKEELRRGRRACEIARTHNLSSSHVYRICQEMRRNNNDGNRRAA